MHKVPEEIILAAQKGDKDACDMIVSSLRGDVYAAALIMLHNREDAEDASQEIFIRVFRNIHNLKDPDAFDKWLRTICLNTCRSYYKENKNDNSNVVPDNLDDLITTNDGEHSGIVPHEFVDNDENNRIIYKLISTLPEKLSQILLLRFYSDLSYQEIANELGISIGTVKSRISSAKGQLLKKIRQYEKKHGITLHSAGLPEGIPAIIESASHFLTIPASIGSNSGAYTAAAANINAAASAAAAAGNTVTNIAATTVSTSVSTTISNSLAAKISAATAAVSVAACIGIVSISNNISADIPPESKSYGESTQADASAAESIPFEQTGDSENGQETVIQSEAGYEQRNEASEIYIDRPYTVHDVSVVHEHDVSTVVEYRDRIVYVDSGSKVIDYNSFADITTDDDRFVFRIYPESMEATLICITVDTGESELVFPSYVSYNGNDIPVVRLARGCCYGNTEDFECVSRVVLPERLQEIPENTFAPFCSLKDMAPNENVTRIGSYAFSALDLDVMDLSTVFPNLLEIESNAFDDCDIGKLILPRGYTYMAENAFTNRIDEISVVYDQQGLFNKSYSFDTDRLNIIFPGSEIILTGANIRSENLKELHLEFEEKDAALQENQSFGELLRYLRAEKLYLPEGMTFAQSYLLDNYDTDTDPTDEPLENPYGNYIENVYIPSTLTDMEAAAFDTQYNTVGRLILPKSGKSEAVLSNIESKILSTGKYICSGENRENKYFSSRG